MVQRYISSLKTWGQIKNAECVVVQVQVLENFQQQGLDFL